MGSWMNKDIEKKLNKVVAFVKESKEYKKCI